ncbi:hypothetical protein LXL04_018220 [Taraxacum kok-saghyz]
MWRTPYGGGRKSSEIAATNEGQSEGGCEQEKQGRMAITHFSVGDSGDKRVIYPNSPPLDKLNSSEGIEDIEDFFPVSDSQRGTTEECYAIEDRTTPEMCLPRSEQPYFANYWIGTDRFPRPHRLLNWGNYCSINPQFGPLS